MTEENLITHLINHFSVSNSSNRAAAEAAAAVRGATPAAAETAKTGAAAAECLQFSLSLYLNFASPAREKTALCTLTPRARLHGTAHVSARPVFTSRGQQPSVKLPLQKSGSLQAGQRRQLAASDSLFIATAGATGPNREPLGALGKAFVVPLLGPWNTPTVVTDQFDKTNAPTFQFTSLSKKKMQQIRPLLRALSGDANRCLLFKQMSLVKKTHHRVVTSLTAFH